MVGFSCNPTISNARALRLKFAKRNELQIIETSRTYSTNIRFTPLYSIPSRDRLYHIFLKSVFSRFNKIGFHPFCRTLVTSTPAIGIEFRRKGNHVRGDHQGEEDLPCAQIDAA
jgi:hypothetical protein